MRKSIFPILLALLLLSSCKTDEEKLTNWVLKDTSEWLVKEMSYDYVRTELSTIEDSGIELSNGFFIFNSDGTGTIEFALAFLGGTLATPFNWTTDGTKVYGDYTGEGAGGGDYTFTFEMEKTAKHGASMVMDYLYTEPGLTEDLDLEMRLSRK